MKEETINLKVGNIAAMTGLPLTVGSQQGGYRLEVGVDHGGTSTTKFGAERRPYRQFIEFLDNVTLGLVLGQE